jgi:hypothetical protein
MTLIVRKGSKSYRTEDTEVTVRGEVTEADRPTGRGLIADLEQMSYLKSEPMVLHPGRGPAGVANCRVSATRRSVMV